MLSDVYIIPIGDEPGRSKADVGLDGEAPVTDDYKGRDDTFTGKIRKVTIDLK